VKVGSLAWLLEDSVEKSVSGLPFYWGGRLVLEKRIRVFGKTFVFCRTWVELFLLRLKRRRRLRLGW
jgi:hypothetical protein